MTLAVLATLTLAAGVELHARPVATLPIRVCMSNPPDVRVYKAKQIATFLLASAGVGLEWLSMGHCPAGSVVITLQPQTPADQRPQWFAHSQPYEGTQVVVFFDRIQSDVAARRVPALLGHVLAHEIAHILERTDSHSPEGVMKLRWSGADYQKMEYNQLRFTEMDVIRIREGLGSIAKRDDVILEDSTVRH